MAKHISKEIQRLVGTEGLEDKTYEFLDKLLALQRPNEYQHRYIHKGQTGLGQTKVVNVEFSPEFVKKYKFLELVQLTDMQFGHKSCKVKYVKAFFDYILEKENRYLLMTGDNIDAATATSMGQPWDNWFGPQSEVYTFCTLLAPLRHRILGYVGGNHERRGLGTFGDLGFTIATLLKLPYSAGMQLLNVNFGEHKPFKIHLWHGLPRAKTKGALAQITDRYMQQGDSQLYLSGHNHQAIVIPYWKQTRDGQGGIKMMKTIGATGTSFLEFWGTYAEVMGLSGSETLMPKVRLYPEGGNQGWEMIIR